MVKHAISSNGPTVSDNSEQTASCVRRDACCDHSEQTASCVRKYACCVDSEQAASCVRKDACCVVVTAAVCY